MWDCRVCPTLLYGSLRYLLMTVSEEMLTLILEKDVYPARLYGCLWHGHVADRVPLLGHVSGSSNLQNRKQENRGFLAQLHFEAII